MCGWFMFAIKSISRLMRSRRRGLTFILLLLISFMATCLFFYQFLNMYKYHFCKFDENFVWLRIKLYRAPGATFWWFWKKLITNLLYLNISLAYKSKSPSGSVKRQWIRYSKKNHELINVWCEIIRIRNT